MCPENIRSHIVNGKSEFVVPSESGLEVSDGRIGEPIPSESDAPETASFPTSIKAVGEPVVRLHQGLSDISVGFLTEILECPATFVASKKDALAGYTVTLSCAMTNSQYASLVTALSTPGKAATVDVAFEPTTPNLVQQDTAPNT